MSVPATDFGSSIARNYEDYLVPLIFEDYARDLAGRVPLGETSAVLETAAGTGVLTRELRARMPELSRLVATDLNSGMLDLARERMDSRRPVEFGLADATSLDYADGSFDAVFCQFGIMFFGDRAQGFAEAARVLRPGGRFAFNVWESLERNPFPGVVHDTVVRQFPVDPPRFLEVPFCDQDFREIKNELQDSGFGEIDIAVTPLTSRAPSAAHIVRAFVAGTPLTSTLVERGILDEAMAVCEEALLREYGPGRIEAPMQAVSFVATRV